MDCNLDIQSLKKFPLRASAEETFRSVVVALGETPYALGERRTLAQMLLCAICAIPHREWLLRRDEVLLSREQTRAVAQATHRLLCGEPIQYILGESVFGAHTLHVAPGVLIPRPETEELCFHVATEWQGKSPVILDLGAGSGAIDIYLAEALSGSCCFAVEKSKEALRILNRNIDHFDPSKRRIRSIEGDMTKPLSLRGSLPPLDILISNPPYVLTYERHDMASHVVNHEPSEALFAPAGDPLFFYKAIRDIIPFLSFRVGARLYLEINARKAQETLALFESSPYISGASLRQDLSGKLRFIFADINAPSSTL